MWFFSKFFFFVQGLERSHTGYNIFIFIFIPVVYPCTPWLGLALALALVWYLNLSKNYTNNALHVADNAMIEDACIHREARR